MFRILRGDVTFGLFLTDRAPDRVVAGPSTLAQTESSEGHNYMNMGDAPARMLVVLDDSPTFQAEIGAIRATCGHHGIEILAGSPPPA